MATKIAALSEKLYECEVKRRRLRSTGPGYEPFWKVKTIQDALVDGDTEFRCQVCHGAVKVCKRNGPNGVTVHVEHKLKRDSEYCTAGAYFANASDGRAPRTSEAPVS